MSRQQEPKQQGKRKKSAPKRPKPQPGSHLSGTEGTGTKHRVCLCPGRIDPKDARDKAAEAGQKEEGTKEKEWGGQEREGRPSSNDNDPAPEILWRFWPPIELTELLAAREKRVFRQRQLLQEQACSWGSLLCFTLNIPGPIKNSPLIQLAFAQGLALLTKRLNTRSSVQEWREAAGCTALFYYPQPAARLKKLCLALEEEQPLGRLFDLDVLDKTGQKLSRPRPRACLLCHRPAFACARSRRHPLEQLSQRVQELLLDFAARLLSEKAVAALLWEARLTPKPGLVDSRNQGAHKDMNLALLEASAQSLADYFAQAVKLGFTGFGPAEIPQPEALEGLRQAGLAAEARMKAVTGGVNTHKGAIYSFGLFLAALGSRLARGGDPFACAARLAAALPQDSQGLSHGCQVLLRYGRSGARGEAAAGFPLARRAWHILRQPSLREQPVPTPLFSLCPPVEEQSGITALLDLLTCCQDTNLLYRGGEAGLAFVQTEAARLLALPSAQRLPLLFDFDDEMIRRNLSPGGCADLLAFACLLTLTESLWFIP